MRAVILSTAFLTLAGPVLAADQPARGRVTFKGQPLPGGTMTFHPSDPKAKPVEAKINEKGWYEVKALPAGEYKVAVTADPKSKFPLPAKYGDPNASGLTVAVLGKEPATFDIELK